MFDMGFAELLLIAVIALLVLGPERMPEAIRTTSRLLRQLRSGFTNLKNEFEREVNADEIRRELHNEAIMEQLNDGELKEDLDSIRDGLSNLEYDIKQELVDDGKKDS